MSNGMDRYRVTPVDGSKQASNNGIGKKPQENFSGVTFSQRMKDLLLLSDDEQEKIILARGPVQTPVLGGSSEQDAQFLREIEVASVATIATMKVAKSEPVEPVNKVDDNSRIYEDPITTSFAASRAASAYSRQQSSSKK